MAKPYQDEDGFSDLEEKKKFLEYLEKEKDYILQLLNKNGKKYSYSANSGGITFSKDGIDIGHVIFMGLDARSHSFYEGNTETDISLIYSKLKRSFNTKELNER